MVTLFFQVISELLILQTPKTNAEISQKAWALVQKYAFKKLFLRTGKNQMTIYELSDDARYFFLNLNLKYTLFDNIRSNSIEIF